MDDTEEREWLSFVSNARRTLLQGPASKSSYDLHTAAESKQPDVTVSTLKQKSPPTPPFVRKRRLSGILSVSCVQINRRSLPTRAYEPMRAQMNRFQFEEDHDIKLFTRKGLPRPRSASALGQERQVIEPLFLELDIDEEQELEGLHPMARRIKLLRRQFDSGQLDWADPGAGASRGGPHDLSRRAQQTTKDRSLLDISRQHQDPTRLMTSLLLVYKSSKQAMDLISTLLTAERRSRSRSPVAKHRPRSLGKRTTSDTSLLQLASQHDAMPRTPTSQPRFNQPRSDPTHLQPSRHHRAKHNQLPPLSQLQTSPGPTAEVSLTKHELLERLMTMPRDIGTTDRDIAFVGFLVKLSDLTQQLQAPSNSLAAERSPSITRAFTSTQSSKSGAACGQCYPARVGGGFMIVGYGNDDSCCLCCGRRLDLNLSDASSQKQLAWALEMGERYRRQFAKQLSSDAVSQGQEIHDQNLLDGSTHHTAAANAGAKHRLHDSDFSDANAAYQLNGLTQLRFENDGQEHDLYEASAATTWTTDEPHLCAKNSSSDDSDEEGVQPGARKARSQQAQHGTARYPASPGQNHADGMSSSSTNMKEGLVDFRDAATSAASPMTLTPSGQQDFEAHTGTLEVGDDVVLTSTQPARPSPEARLATSASRHSQRPLDSRLSRNSSAPSNNKNLTPGTQPMQGVSTADKGAWDQTRTDSRNGVGSRSRSRRTSRVRVITKSSTEPPSDAEVASNETHDVAASVRTSIASSASIPNSVASDFSTTSSIGSTSSAGTAVPEKRRSCRVSKVKVVRKPISSVDLSSSLFDLSESNEESSPAEVEESKQHPDPPLDVDVGRSRKKLLNPLPALQQELIKMPTSKRMPRLLASEEALDVVQESEEEPELDELEYVSSTAGYLSQVTLIDERVEQRYKTVFDKADKRQTGALNEKQLSMALRSVCRPPLSDKETEFVLRVLDLMEAQGLKRDVDFKLFTIVAALAERVTKLDDMIKDDIKQIRFDGLDARLKTALDLFYLNDHQHKGYISKEQLSVEFTAGSLTEAHQAELISHFKKQGIINMSFLDFLAYMPLFINIHDNVMKNPLDTALIF
eukprot:TRINITY_DN10592_c0_g1_i8.p1 TRINITY_DN10592_c0_g1~~TRINITY_DN10592_c0_g1_i8.p1  ORF type:complete len:1087 (+),score=164.07 TRINITY_DN10592_c0_g1_i8:23-3283(+)